MPTKGRVLVAMSGGVDSSVTAYLLQQKGYEVLGATMYLHDPGNAPLAPGKSCCGLGDIQDAQAVCMRLGIPHRALDFREDFESDVIEKFVATYRAGATPNPCIDCNRYLKFDALLETALDMGCDYIATGHYARVEELPDGTFALKKGADPAKEQSYVLYMLGQEQLAHLLLPLGALYKERDVRRIAAEQGLVNAAKPDSQDICFVPDGDFAAFLERKMGTPLPAGDILDEKGTVIGRHKGAIRYTPGQRKGLGVASERPLYVSRIDPVGNTVTLAPNEALFSRALVADDWIWSAPAARMEALLDDAGARIAAGAPRTEAGVAVGAKLRYHQPDQEAHLSWADPAEAAGATGRALRLDFAVPQRAIAPGQAVVVYDGDTLLGGGTARRALAPATGPARGE